MASFMFFVPGNAIFIICSLALLSFRKIKILIAVSTSTNTQLSMTHVDMAGTLPQVESQFHFAIQKLLHNPLKQGYRVGMIGKLLMMVVLGGIFGTVGDYSHVASQTDGYLNPLYPLPTGQPFWVPFLFGSAALGIAVSHLTTRKLFGLKSPRHSLGFLLAGVLFFLALYAASGFLPLATGGPKDAVLWVSCLIFWWIADRTWQGLAMGLGTAIVGTIVEISLTQIGAFYYFPEVNNFMGVPSWLPALYVTASVSVGNLAGFIFANTALSNQGHSGGMPSEGLKT